MGRSRAFVFPKTPRLGLLDGLKGQGFVYWEVVDDKSGKVVRSGEGHGERTYWRFIPSWLHSWLPLGHRNAIVDHARAKLADAFIGNAATYPTFIGLGTGTNAVAASDTALQTKALYDGTNEAKAASGRSLKGLFTSRIVVQFLTTEANITVREIGLFEANDVDANMWARVNVNVTKTSSERLNIYWYITFERRAGLAIKSGASIATTGNISAATTSTLTFASAVTIFIITNNSGEVMYVKLNEALSGSPPTNYDFIVADGQTVIQSDEEIEVTTVHVFKASALTMPHNDVSVRGW